MRLRLISLGIIGFALLASCSMENLKARSVAKSFLTAIVNEDFETAGNYATKEGKMALQTLESLSSGMQELRSQIDEDEGEIPAATFKIIAITVEGNRALATYTMTDSDGPQTLELEKIEGEWKVDFKKSF